MIVTNESKWIHWAFPIVSVLLTMLIIFGFILNAVRIESHIETHIDQTIADTVKKATTGTPNPATVKLFKQIEQICKATPGCTP